MPFFEYNQNNSGGSFDYVEEAGITHNVIIEADDAREADWRAEQIGLYFGGEGDCECCGDRWYPQVGWGSAPDGDEVPSHYGEPLTDEYDPAEGPTNFRWIAEGRADIFVHFKDGKIKGYGR